MIEYILLGFLMYGEMTGYDLKQCMSNSTSNFYDTSFGSIYPALKRLETADFVSMRTDLSGSRTRKLYCILPAGREHFLVWMESPMEILKRSIDTEPLIRVFFLSLIEPEKAKTMISGFRELVTNEQEHLKAIGPHVAAVADRFQLATLHFGVGYYQYLATWLDRILEMLEQHNQTEEGSENNENYSPERQS